MNLAALLALIRRRWAAILLCFIVGIVGAFSVTRSTPKAYASTARLFVTIPAARGVGEALQGVQLSSQLLASYSRIATSVSTARLASIRLEGRFTASEIHSKIAAAPVPETLLIDVKAVDLDPASARDIANATADSLIEVIKNLEATSGVEARVIDAAVANPAPIRPRPKVDLAIGGLLGLAVGAGLALVLEALDRTITTADQATAAFGAPSLAALPRDRGLATEPLVALEGANSRSGEGYRSLRTAIRFIDGDRQLRRILISSAGSGEGKTTVAANLAIAFAQSGERVILIDADLRRPRVTELFGVNERPGLTAVILGDVSLEAALQTWRGTLQLLPHGALPPNPSEMLGSESMARVLDEAADRADIVIIDAPPILPVTDATVLAAQVDGVIQVARWGSTAVSDGEATRRTLEAVNAHVVGVALNAVRRGRRSGYYRQYAPAASGRG